MKALKIIIGILCALVLFWVVVNIIPANKVCEENPWLGNGTTLISAHRGGSKLNPENTEKAFDYVILETDYCDIIEIDIQYTKDGVLVIHHDDYVNRMALEDQENKVYLKDLDYSELKNYNLGRNYIVPGETEPRVYKDLSISEAEDLGLTIMTLEEFLTKYKEARDFKLYLEIKPKDESGLKMIREVEELLNSSKYSWWKDRTMIISFYDKGISYIIDEYEDQYVGALGYKIAPQLIGYILRLDSLINVKYHSLQTKMVQNLGPISANVATERMVESCHARNQSITFWTINDRSDMEYLVSIKADVITTDCPNVLAEVLGK